MKKHIIDRVDALRTGADSQEEFMKQLAEFDEHGELTDSLQREINGGKGIIDTIIYLGGLLGGIKPGQPE